MKIAIWAAVSSKKQAEKDKDSIPVQIEAGETFILQNKHTLTGKYIVPGQSRTEYISLSHAEDHIPQLKQLMDDAARGKFQAVWVYDLNRFRNLMLQIFQALTEYGIQIYNHADPDDLLDPKDFTPEIINSRYLKVQLHFLISGQETNKLQKHFKEKMPKRIERGLHPGLGTPLYGYRKPPHLLLDRKAVLEQVPAEVQTLLQMKDWFLREGLSLTAIAARLNQNNIPSSRGKRWHFSIVRYLLANPFYAGIVRYGITERKRDRRLLTVQRTKGENPITAQGLHQPIWDLATHQQILDEIQRRARAQPGISIRAFTRLLICECDKVLWAQKTPAGNYWRCSTLTPGHTYISDKKAHDLIIPKLIEAIKNKKEKIIPAPKDETPALQRTLRDLATRQKRLIDIYEEGTIDKDEYNKRIAEIKSRITTTRRLLEQKEQSLTRNLAFQTHLTEFQNILNDLPQYIRHAPPARVNAQLHTILAGIKITKKDHKIILLWNM